MSVISKHSSMVFFSDGEDHYSQRVRMVLAEKGVAVEIINVEKNQYPEDLVALNPITVCPPGIETSCIRDDDHDGKS